jgi:hypothetical protein
MLKKFTYLFFLISLLGCKGGNSEKAADYNEKIMVHLENISSEYSTMVESYNTEDYDAATLHLNNCKVICDKAYAALAKLGSFNGDEELIYAAKSSVATYKSIVKNEYPTMIEKARYVSDPDNIQSYNTNVNVDLLTFAGELEVLANKVNEKARKSDSITRKTQRRFFNTYGIHYSE